MAPPSSPTPMSPGSVLGTMETGQILVPDAGWDNLVGLQKSCALWQFGI